MKCGFVVFVVSILAGHSGLVTGGDAATTTAAIAFSTYDVPALARVDSRASSLPEAGRISLGGAREWSAVRSA